MNRNKLEWLYFGVFSLVCATACGDVESDRESASGSGISGITSQGGSETSDEMESDTTGSDEDESSGTDSSGDLPPTPSVCGDGLLDLDEECDNGEFNGPGASCLDNCTANTCGDGDKGPEEICDLGDENNDNGACKTDCTLNYCGDGFVGPNEGCDDGNKEHYDACTNDCKVQTCGDGVLDEGEECDDGNDDNDDGCKNTCVLPPSPCGTQAHEATLEKLPVDIVIVIDNSGSMGAEIEGVQDNININFANIIEQSGLDYRVIMVSEHGPFNGPESICVEAPLSGVPEGGCQNPPPAPVHNPGKFYHYSVPIASHNAWCQLLNHFPVGAKDQFGEDGYSQWLRPNAFKTIIGISDDGIACGEFYDGDNEADGVEAAQAFDEALLAMAPEQFGTADKRRYQYYSIAGMAYNNPQSQPYGPDEAMVTQMCPTAVDPGSGHQGASMLTQALRFPLCDTSSYDAVFQAIAQGVIEGSPVECSFKVPTPPEGEELDPESIVINYTPMGMGEPIALVQVDGLDQCTDNGFYIDGDAMHLCPAACELVQQDFDAQVGIEFACLPDVG